MVTNRNLYIVSRTTNSKEEISMISNMESLGILIGAPLAGTVLLGPIGGTIAFILAAIYVHKQSNKIEED